MCLKSFHKKYLSKIINTLLFTRLSIDIWELVYSIVDVADKGGHRKPITSTKNKDSIILGKDGTSFFYQATNI